MSITAAAYVRRHDSAPRPHWCNGVTRSRILRSGAAEAGARVPGGVRVRRSPSRRRSTQGRDRIRSRTGCQARGVPSRRTSLDPRQPAAAPLARCRRAVRARPAPDCRAPRHRFDRRRAPVESRRSSSRSPCRPPDRHGHGRTRLGPSEHGAGIAGRRGGQLGMSGIARRGGWGGARRRGSRHTASTRICPSSFSRPRCPSMVKPRCAGSLPRHTIRAQGRWRIAT